MTKNSFNAGLKITTPAEIPDMFPTWGARILGQVNMTRDHYMPACQSAGDDAVSVYPGNPGSVYVNGEFRCDLPEGSVVESERRR